MKGKYIILISLITSLFNAGLVFLGYELAIEKILNGPTLTYLQVYVAILVLNLISSLNAPISDFLNNDKELEKEAIERSIWFKSIASFIFFVMCIILYVITL